MNVMERVLLINQRCLLQPSLQKDLYSLWSTVLPHLLLCHSELFVSVCVCTCHLPCLCLFCFFSDGLCCFAAVYRTFFPFACGRSVCAFLLPCDLQAITINLSLCGIPAFPTVPPFSCHCTPMTGVLWPLLRRQCRFLADISSHSSAVLRQWCLHSVIYSTWTPNTMSCHFPLLQFLKMHVCSFLVIKQTGFFKFVSERWTRQSMDCNNVIDVHW